MTADRLRLHFNENTAGCSPAVIDALRTLTATDVARYPEYDAITATVAAWLGVSADQVLLTSGLDEGLYAVAQDGVRRAGNAREPQFLQTDPTFEMFEEFTRMVGATLVRIEPAADFAFPLAGLLDAITPETRVIYLVDPNNPTGLPLPAGAAAHVASMAPQALVLVDEAYADFSGQTLVRSLPGLPSNLVVGRTFAKGHGLAGLRIGALVARADTIARIRRVMPPFNVNIAAVRALDAALKDEDYLRWSVAQATDSRRLIEAYCDRRGLRYWPSAGNFVLVRVGDQAAAITHELAARGIDVRDKSAAPGCDGCLRLTAGVVAHTEQLISALEDTLASRTN